MARRVSAGAILALMKARPQRWLDRHGLKLNEEKTRLLDIRQEGFKLLGFGISWRQGKSGRAHPHIEPPTQKPDEAAGQTQPLDAVACGGGSDPELRRLLRGWGGYFHSANRPRGLDGMNSNVVNRVQRWLWRQSGGARGLWTTTPRENRPSGSMRGGARRSLAKVPLQPVRSAYSTQQGFCKPKLPCQTPRMGDMNEFSLPIRLFLKAYRWRRIDPVPWMPLRKPLAQCRLALVSSAGFVLPGQAPFDDHARGGDFSFREIPDDADLSKLVDCHRSESFDHTGLARDPNLVLPITRVNELAGRGRIGASSRRHFSFMGSITAPGRLVKETAPQAAQRLVEDQVDVALLVPV